jgi:hypothetical protein
MQSPHNANNKDTASGPLSVGGRFLTLAIAVKPKALNATILIALAI